MRGRGSWGVWEGEFFSVGRLEEFIGPDMFCFLWFVVFLPSFLPSPFLGLLWYPYTINPGPAIILKVIQAGMKPEVSWLVELR